MTALDGVDLVSRGIDEKHARLTPNDPECCIFRVHTELRNINKKAYEPRPLAIGPYHRGKDDLKQMEEHKLRYLKLLQRRNESSVERYINAMRELEGSARKCYAEPSSLTTDEFVEMMLLDGCFIIELFRKWAKEELRDECGPIFQLSWMSNSLYRDLVLLENQLPLFVLTKLIKMTQVPNQQENLIYFSMLYSGLVISQSRSLQNIEHDLRPLACNIGHVLALAHKSVTPSYVQISRGGNVVEWKSIPSATELQEAGIKFKNVERGGILFDIKFNNGVMKIPLSKIGDRSESFF